MEPWGIVLAALIGGAAWTYQKAWDRQQERMVSYQAITDRFSGFMGDTHDPEKVRQILEERQRLWLFAPAPVIRAANEFIDTVRQGQPQPDEVKETAFKAFVLAMRRDASLASALVPHFFGSKLSMDDIRIDRAT